VQSDDFGKPDMRSKVREKALWDVTSIFVDETVLRVDVLPALNARGKNIADVRTGNFYHNGQGLDFCLFLLNFRLVQSLIGLRRI